MNNIQFDFQTIYKVQSQILHQPCNNINEPPKPEGVGGVLSGATEGAAVVPEDGAGDHTAVRGLQVVRPETRSGSSYSAAQDQLFPRPYIWSDGSHKSPEEALSLAIPVAEAAVFHFLHVHLGDGRAGRWRKERRRGLMILHPVLLDEVC